MLRIRPDPDPTKCGRSATLLLTMCKIGVVSLDLCSIVSKVTYVGLGQARIWGVRGRRQVKNQTPLNTRDNNVLNVLQHALDPMKHTVGLLGPARKILTKCCVQMACGMLSAIGDFLQTGIDEIMKVNTADILIVCFVSWYACSFVRLFVCLFVCLTD